MSDKPETIIAGCCGACDQGRKLCYTPEACLRCESEGEAMFIRRFWLTYIVSFVFVLCLLAYVVLS